MKRFRFQLDPLLRLRLAKEREKQRAVAALERERLTIEEEISALQGRLAGGRDELRSAIVGRVDLSVLRAHAAVALHAHRRARQLVIALAGVHRRIESARAELREAMRSRRAIELLRERRLEQWKKARLREDQFKLDDLPVSAASNLELRS